MRKLILKMSVSADGFVCGLNGEIDWLLRTMNEDTVNWLLDTLWMVDVHIMGSRTFYDMASYWPFSNDPLAAPMNAIPKIAFSKKGNIDPKGKNPTTRAIEDSTRFDAEKGLQIDTSRSDQLASWDNATVFSGDLAEEIIRLKQQPGKNILAHGGAGFAQSLVKLGLIDEYQLLIHPVALGKGLPLFADLPQPLHLHLVNTSVFKGGIVAQIYCPA